MAINIGGEVERMNGKVLSYNDFVERYLKRNQPVVLTGLMDGWRACADWVTSDGRPNLHFMDMHFGGSIVQVADCGRREFTDQKRMEMSVSKFITQWLQHFDLDSAAGLTCDGNTDDSLLYLKDWHFVKEFPQYIAYATPPFFVDDWLNLYLDSYSMQGSVDPSHGKTDVNCSDYRFVYMGPKGTWTPLHADVFRSYSWSANVCGKKKWFFLPPPQRDLVFDVYKKYSVYDILNDVSEKRFPGFKETVWMECIQERNEIIFVPSGWYHQVHNLEDTISINHNWFNGYNLSCVWNLLLRDYEEAKGYIEDIRSICDNFEELCQRNLAANTGMNFLDFFIFITRFCLANLITLYHLKSHEVDAISCATGTLHSLLLNVISIRKVALKMISAEAFSVENIQKCSIAAIDIKKLLEEPRFFELCMGVGRTLGLSEVQLQRNFSVRGTSICAECSQKLIQFRADLKILEVNDFQIFSPEELVGLIDCALTDLNDLNSACSIDLSVELYNQDKIDA